MTFVASVRSGFTNYWNFRGRASRSEFWWFILFGWLCSGFANALIAVATAQSNRDLLAIFFYAVGVFLFLPLIIPSFSGTTRRLHDSGKSGWWQFAPIVNFGAVIWAIGTFDLDLPLSLLLLLLYLPGIVVFFWQVRKGSNEPNKYGPAPVLE
mgnify:CR=1 FL=1